MYTDSDLESAVTKGIFTRDSVERFRQDYEQQHASPIVDEENFRLVSGFNDIFVVVISVVVLLSSFAFFSSMFGGRRAGQRNVKFRGQDFQATLHLNLQDVYHTHKRTLTINGKNIRLTIPAGVKNGQTIKIKGYGGEGINGGPKGDLHITFQIDNHTKFKRDGNNLYTNVDLE